MTVITYEYNVVSSTDILWVIFSLFCLTVQNESFWEFLNKNVFFSFWNRNNAIKQKKKANKS